MITTICFNENSHNDNHNGNNNDTDNCNNNIDDMANGQHNGNTDETITIMTMVKYLQTILTTMQIKII